MSSSQPPIGTRVRLIRPLGSYPAGTEGTVVAQDVALMNGYDVTVEMYGPDAPPLVAALNFYADEIEPVGDIAERETSE